MKPSICNDQAEVVGIMEAEPRTVVERPSQQNDVQSTGDEDRQDEDVESRDRSFMDGTDETDESSSGEVTSQIWTTRIRRRVLKPKRKRG